MAFEWDPEIPSQAAHVIERLRAGAGQQSRRLARGCPGQTPFSREHLDSWTEKRLVLSPTGPGQGWA